MRVLISQKNAPHGLEAHAEQTFVARRADGAASDACFSDERAHHHCYSLLDSITTEPAAGMTQGHQR